MDHSAQNAAILTEAELAEIDARLTATARQLGAAQRAMEELIRSEIAMRVAKLPDGFWLVQAREVVRRLRGDPAWQNSSFGTGVDLWNLLHQLDSVVAELDRRSRQGGTV